MSNYCKECYKKQEEIEELKAELKKYEDMAKKGLDEFKDVGGCWGCGLQLQLNQDMEDIKQLKAECEMLKKANFTLRERTINYSEYKERQYKQALEDIRDIATALYMNNWLQMNETAKESIKLLQAKINEVIGAEE